jgi:hypothetical protein
MPSQNARACRCACPRFSLARGRDYDLLCLWYSLLLRHDLVQTVMHTSVPPKDISIRNAQGRHAWRCWSRVEGGEIRTQAWHLQCWRSDVTGLSGIPLDLQRRPHRGIWMARRAHEVRGRDWEIGGTEKRWPHRVSGTAMVRRSKRWASTSEPGHLWAARCTTAT